MNLRIHFNSVKLVCEDSFNECATCILFVVKLKNKKLQQQQQMQPQGNLARCIRVTWKHFHSATTVSACPPLWAGAGQETARGASLLSHTRETDGQRRVKTGCSSILIPQTSSSCFPLVPVFSVICVETRDLRVTHPHSQCSLWRCTEQPSQSPCTKTFYSFSKLHSINHPSW